MKIKYQGKETETDAANVAFRDRIVQIAADNMSAGSRVTPGGYAVLEKAHAADVAQFTLSDSRSPA